MRSEDGGVDLTLKRHFPVAGPSQQSSQKETPMHAHHSFEILGEAKNHAGPDVSRFIALGRDTLMVAGQLSQRMLPWMKWLVVVALLVAWATHPAKAQIFWATNNNTIGRANVDGKGVNEKFITGASHPAQIATDGTYIYWANYGNGTISRALPDGTEVDLNFITGASNSLGLAVTTAGIFWTNAFGTGFTIGNASLDGSGVNQSFIDFGETASPTCLAAHGNYIYWGDVLTGTIGRAKTDGTDVNDRFINSAGVPGLAYTGACGIAVNGGFIYWSTDNRTIARADIDGTHVNSSFISAPTKGGSIPFNMPVGLRVNGVTLYWVANGVIGQALVDGTDVTQSFISGNAHDGTVVLPVASCGIGGEAALLLPLLMRLRARWRRAAA
jgi:hypothetical protein